MTAIRSDLGWSTPDRIVVRGRDLPGEILGVLNLGDMAFFELTGRVPDAKESRLFNAMAVTLVEHGVTPSALAARLTYLGAPEAMQAAVAAGLCGLGSVFVGSMEGAAKLLSEAVKEKRMQKPLLPRTSASPASDTLCTSRSTRGASGSSRSPATPGTTESTATSWRSLRG